MTDDQRVACPTQPSPFVSTDEEEDEDENSDKNEEEEEEKDEEGQRIWLRGK